MVLLALLLSVNAAMAQVGFQIGIYSFPQLVLGGASGGGLSPGAIYRAKLLFGQFPQNPIVLAQYEEPGGQGNYSGWYQFTSFSTGVANEVAFQVPVWFNAPSANIRVFMPTLNGYTATTRVGMTPMNPAVYACSGYTGTYYFQTPNIYAGTTLPYSGGQLYTSCATQNATQIPQGVNIIIGGTGFAGYLYDYATGVFTPFVDNPELKVIGSGTILPYLGFYETPDHQQQLMFQVPANLGASSQQVSLTVNGRTAYFIVTFI